MPRKRSVVEQLFDAAGSIETESGIKKEFRKSCAEIPMDMLLD